MLNHSFNWAENVCQPIGETLQTNLEQHGDGDADGDFPECKC